MWEREADFTALLQSVQQRASRGSIDALAQLAVEDHKAVSIFILLVASGVQPEHAKGACRLHSLTAHAAAASHGAACRLALLIEVWYQTACCMAHIDGFRLIWLI
jgi:hypothetical protein